MAKKRKTPPPSKRAPKSRARAPKRRAAGEAANGDATLSVLDGPMKAIIRAQFLK